ncbi:Cucumisin [Vitis vinifera]|uniref:Cucumisin n=1 Tax=Vitis vinifera TaxID=29760 RepID=A0A438ILD6_VITVI|nr:Cucumisin [Vitis vinifera]
MGTHHTHLVNEEDDDDEDAKDEDVYMYPTDMNPDERDAYRSAVRASKASNWEREQHENIVGSKRKTGEYSTSIPSMMRKSQSIRHSHHSLSVTPSLYKSSVARQKNIKDIFKGGANKETMGRLISKFFIYESVAPPKAKSHHFKNMIIGAQQAGMRIEPSSPYEIKNKYLEMEYKEMEAYLMHVMKENLIRQGAGDWMFKIIQDRWEKTLKHPLHAAAEVGEEEDNQLFQWVRPIHLDDEIGILIHELPLMLENLELMLNVALNSHQEIDSTTAGHSSRPSAAGTSAFGYDGSRGGTNDGDHGSRRASLGIGAIGKPYRGRKQMMEPYNKELLSGSFESMSIRTQFSDSSNEANIYPPYVMSYGQPSSSIDEEYGMSRYSPSRKMSYQVPYQMEGGFGINTWVNFEYLIHVEAVGRTQEIYAWHEIEENMDSVIWFYDANLQPQVQVMETTISSNSPCLLASATWVVVPLISSTTTSMKHGRKAKGLFRVIKDSSIKAISIPSSITGIPPMVTINVKLFVNCDKVGHSVKVCHACPPPQLFPRGNYMASDQAEDGGTWIIDLGASHHITPDHQNLLLYSEYGDNKDIMIGNGNGILITHEYIVYMGDLPKGQVSASSLHANILQQVTGRHGRGCVCVPNGKKKLLTTRSWDFIGFPLEANRTTTESDIIVGMLDTGIWPEADSFSDEGYGPPPTKWQGTCQTSSNFTCNNKIIGARYYRSDGNVPPEDFASPRDTEGHGTHTASTAAGNVVSGASLLGLGAGTARGGTPSARIAVYKICWADGCYDADILAAFDDAIADGVNIISLSVGGSFPLDYFEDSIAIGAFHSMKNGILTSNAGGNSGPDPGSITNFSPWSLSVAASVIDRKFLTALHLGNNLTYEGELSLNTFEMNGMSLSFMAGMRQTRQQDLMHLIPGENVKSVVVLLRGHLEHVSDLSLAFPLPTSCLDSNYTTNVHEYINSTSTPTANIQKSTEAKNELAPFVVWFSSRGPNPITRDILSPDIAAPGVNILAAWTEASSLTGVPGDTRVVPYNIISGTSMACPHASGAAAYVKSFHPTWSPAAIKSALMTTASPLSAETNTDLEFSYGAGYNTTKLHLVTGENITCSAATNGTVWDLNYPSFAISTEHEAGVNRTFTRTVTNVGSPVSTYKAIVVGPPEFSIKVEPGVLSFKSLGETQTFTVTVGVAALSNPVISGSWCGMMGFTK